MGIAKPQLELRSCRPVTEVLEWEIPGSALGRVPKGAQGNRGALAVLQRVLSEIGGVPGIPKNLFRLFLTFRVISILQGYFWRPSEKTL